MPWMHLDNLQAFMPDDATTPAPQSTLLATLVTLRTAALNVADTAQEHVNQMKEVVRGDLEGLMVARQAQHAWQAQHISRDTRQELRWLIAWAVPQLGARWQDTWSAADLGVKLTLCTVAPSWVREDG